MTAVDPGGMFEVEVDSKVVELGPVDRAGCDVVGTSLETTPVATGTFVAVARGLVVDVGPLGIKEEAGMLQLECQRLPSRTTGRKLTDPTWRWREWRWKAAELALKSAEGEWGERS